MWYIQSCCFVRPILDVTLALCHFLLLEMLWISNSITITMVKEKLVPIIRNFGLEIIAMQTQQYGLSVLFHICLRVPHLHGILDCEQVQEDVMSNCALPYICNLMHQQHSCNPKKTQSLLLCHSMVASTHCLVVSKFYNLTSIIILTTQSWVYQEGLWLSVTDTLLAAVSCLIPIAVVVSFMQTGQVDGI